ncbi:hypothetical protein O6H91_18G051900 [Diphasiastrum complanatum]|uniref:Uncharacterized protein n=8 Tax=Diphasiastrum complanatum TaxID=34168 RepID=A0ACC2B156_DIPCM|nr:hypothetical protein O6H91_18G051900 [Diphasiastrum complanatum]KAJ7523494.1 hypothetical protein O6H91_18G051900 [Diphasiastrum complanatum]KAJ7523495.1 hypothetical protein O6H91_18G051900 [Diphasiastrum complanatum]KAJ7523496.1 hypothetical protein O6H91_18G051900 [Diphasiastrum complanatum]KAJ7523497.1 hypothetical protein O6H91_18G051900 [Diphasiastrum complanatum]
MVGESEKDAVVGPTYGGWVYHMGLNSLGYQFCHARYLLIKGKYAVMFKRDPSEYPGRKPIRQGVVGQYLMVEEIGRQIYHGRVLYLLKIYSRMDHTKQGQFGCGSPDEVEKWITAFQHAKEEAEYDLEKQSSRRFINGEAEFKLNGPRKHNRAYAKSLNKLIYIGRGPESLMRRPSVVAQEPDSENFYSKGESDAVEQADWRCFRTVNGLRIFEDVAASNSKSEKGTIMKSVGVVKASPDVIFETIMSLDKSVRHQWDVLTGELELVEHIDGHADIVYGTFDTKYFKRWKSFFNSKRDFLFSRYWRRDQDGSYYITQISATHIKRPPKRGYCRLSLNPGVWEITPLPSRPGTTAPRSLVTQIMEITTTGWGRWKRSHYSQFHSTVPYVLLCRTAGLREYLAAENEVSTLNDRSSMGTISKVAKQVDIGSQHCEAPETSEQFYDAIMADDPNEDDESSEEDEKKPLNKKGNHQFRKATWTYGPARREFLVNTPAIHIDASKFRGSLWPAANGKDSNCWADPGGKGFMVRGKTYNKDYLKIPGGDPVLKLLAVDWYQSDEKLDMIARHPECVVQSEAGKKLPFILVVNLQVPARPNYSLVFYFGSNRPIRSGSLLDEFVHGDDTFRNSRFKLIPSIVEGYWVVKRAVGTKACLLGRAVTCHYLQEHNFLEIDVDIGSSTVARGVIGLVLGYVTNLVVDLAVLIEAKDERELPEYLLGTVRISRIKPESAKPF